MKNILFLFLLISSLAFGQKTPKVDLSNPRATVYTHFYFLQNSSYQPKKSAKTIDGLDEKKAEEVAIKIKRILDGKGLKIDFNTISNDSMYTDSTSFLIQQKFVLFPERMPLISVEKKEDSWYYSSETIENIDQLYAEIFPWYINKIQNLVPVAGNRIIFAIKVWQYIAFIILILLSILTFIISKLLAYVFLKRILYKFTKNKNSEINSTLKKLAHPISLLIAVWLIDKTLPSLQLGLEINRWLFLAVNIVSTIFWIYVFLKLSHVLTYLLSKYTEKTNNKLDDQLTPILRNFTTVLIIIGGVFKLLFLFGVDPTTILAGASIGGLAVAFASQDTVKNLIGTVMIFIDKPFHIGDWISAGEVEGTVEEVGFRSSRIRAVDTTIFQIPNSTLSEIVINNSGLRLYRRYQTHLGLRYDTPPELIEAFVKGVREIIKAHPDTKSDSYNVEFTGFGDSALLILMNMYLKSLAWSKEQQTKHQIHMAIVKLAKALGVDFAFPSTTVMIEQFPDKKTFEIQYDADPKRIDEVIDNVVEDFKKNSTKE